MTAEIQDIANLSLAVAYMLLGLLIFFIEHNGIRRHGIRSHLIFLAFYFIYVIFPSVLLHFLLAWDNSLETGIGFFDRTIENLTFINALTVYVLHLLFIFSFYALKIYLERKGRSDRRAVVEISFSPVVLWLFLAFGFFVVSKFFLDLGSNLSERYASLILFRGLSEEIERNFFNANAFSLTMTFSWLCGALIFYYWKNRKPAIFLLVVSLCFFFSFMMGSRKAFIFPILILFFCFSVYNNRLYIARMAWFLPFVIAWIAVGKELTGSVAYQPDGYSFSANYASYLEALLRAACDIGIGQIQSYATLEFFDWNFRLGVDHLYSILRCFPDGMLGIEDIFPERITRIATAAFESPEALDIPPGLIGASWFDFPFLGASAWGLAMAAQCFLVEKLRRSCVKTPALIVLVVFFMIIVAMPINTGSLDFTFSIDILFLVFVLLASLRVRFLQSNRCLKS